jgi:hypothetical protein
LFTYKHKYSVLHDSWGNARAEGCGEYGEVIVDYAILPEYDEMLERYNDLEVAQTENINGM